MSASDSQIFRELMRFKPEAWSANAWAVQAGVSRTVWTDMRRHGNPSRRTLEKLLSAAGSSLAEFEALRVSDAYAFPTKAKNFILSDSSAGKWRAAPIAGLPHIESATGGSWGNLDDQIDVIELNLGRIVGQISRPEALRNDARAYAFTVTSNAMRPRFKPGRKIAVSPVAKVEIGDDVLVTVAADPSTGNFRVLLAELVKQGPRHLDLRQYNPERIYRVGSDEISSIDKVVGELI